MQYDLPEHKCDVCVYVFYPLVLGLAIRLALVNGMLAVVMQVEILHMLTWLGLAFGLLKLPRLKNASGN